MLEAAIIKRRRDFTVDAHLVVNPGADLALFGASGAGKSTILSCLAGIEQPDQGCIRFEGAQMFPPPMPLYLRPIGYLTQEPNLFPHLTVEGNVAFGLNGGSRDWLAHLRSELNLQDVWKAPATQISGGQARRVAMARMLARRPRLVLLDEPFRGLDRQLVRELIGALLAWKAETGFTLIVVDHESEILQRLCSRVAVVSRGRIVQEGEWSQVRAAPVDATLADLLRPL